MVRDLWRGCEIASRVSCPPLATGPVRDRITRISPRAALTASCARARPRSARPRTAAVALAGSLISFYQLVFCRIEDWLKTKNIDPMTGETLKIKALFPDEDMKQRCTQYLESLRPSISSGSRTGRGRGGRGGRGLPPPVVT